jgi:SAM-dependent methyltransferase
MFDLLRKRIRPITNIVRALIDMAYAPSLYFLAGRKANGIVGNRNAVSARPMPPNPLETYFDSGRTGPGLWKWRHYFEAYHTHFSKFRGARPKIVEIGVYSGGSLEMWREYFGKDCELYGVDINQKCLKFGKENVTIKIANQSNRPFWRKLLEEIGDVDIVIDDGGHRPRQQIPTFEEVISRIKPGGVYLCEDIHGLRNPFAAYLRGIANGLNDDRFNSVQARIKSVTFYPYIAVVEIRDTPLAGLSSEKSGDQWIE